MPGGTAELPILFRGASSTVITDAGRGSSHSPTVSYSQAPHAVGDVFNSILRFLHIDSGLPHTAAEDAHSSEPKSTTSTQRSRAGTQFGDEPQPFSPAADSARSFSSETAPSAPESFSEARQNSTGPLVRATTSAAPLAESSSLGDAHHSQKKSSSKHRRRSFASGFAAMFLPRRKKSPLSRPRLTPNHAEGSEANDPLQPEHGDNGSVPRRSASSIRMARDDFLAQCVLIEGDEDDDRNEFIQLEDAIFNVLLSNFHSELKVLREKTIWNSDAGGEVSEAQLHTIYFMFFRQMKCLLSQQFSHIFPHGIHGTALSMHDVSACVAALCLVEMAITDDDVHSFAFSVYAGRRISLQNCPPSKRYLYFMFMAFKCTVPTFRAHMDQFRSAVVRYFYDRNSIKKSGHPFAFPIQSLLNAVAPVLVSAHFQKMTPSFYYYALSLEKERLGEDSEDDDAVEEHQTLIAHSTVSETIAGPSESAESPHTEDGHSATDGKRRRPRKLSGGVSSRPQNWSTIALNYRKAGGEVIGQGAYGTVYRCYDASNGAFYALKEISLLTHSMKRRIRQHQDKRRQVDDGFGGGDALGSSTSSIKLVHLLTEKERDEIRSREKCICGEINMLKTLRHPAIVSYYGCSFDRKTLKVSILMEYCPKTLRAIIDDVGALPLSMIAHYSSQILNGIAFLHDNHVVHRDIKAANILVKDGGEAKVSDFGTAILNEMHSDATAAAAEEEHLRRQVSSDGGEALSALFSQSTSAGAAHHGKHHHHSKSSRAASSISERTQSFTIQGTPLFLAPEVANGCLPTESSDIWSFGCLLIEMASGVYPWHEWTNGEENIPLEMIVFHIGFATEPPQLLSEYAEHASHNNLFVDMLSQCLRLDPVARPTARELLQHAFFRQEFAELDESPCDDPGVGAPENSGDIEEVHEAAGALNGNVMSIVPNDSLAFGPSGVY